MIQFVNGHYNGKDICAGESVVPSSHGVEVEVVIQQKEEICDPCYYSTQVDLHHILMGRYP
jgi:hypothetical protein